MNIVFLPQAQSELDDAFSWYEEQAVGLGHEFLDELDQALRLMATFPEFQPQITEKIRRCLVNRFPYGIYYGINGKTLVVVAIAHLKQKPAYWIKRRLE